MGKYCINMHHRYIHHRFSLDGCRTLPFFEAQLFVRDTHDGGKTYTLHTLIFKLSAITTLATNVQHRHTQPTSPFGDDLNVDSLIGPIAPCSVDHVVKSVKNKLGMFAWTYFMNLGLEFQEIYLSNVVKVTCKYNPSCTPFVIDDLSKVVDTLSNHWELHGVYRRV